MEIIDRYRRSLKRRNYAAHTVKAYTNVLAQFTRWLEVPLERVTRSEMGAYVDHLFQKRLSPKTVTCHLQIIRALGDSTSRDEGRLTLNPVKHIDPFGLILLIVAGFGGQNRCGSIQRNSAIPVATRRSWPLAGPFSNLLLAFLLALCLRLLVAGGAGAEVMNTLLTAMFVNLGLFVFNMIPIPPLDGSHLYLPFLKSGNQRIASMLSRYGAFAFLGVIILEQVTRVDILPIGGAVRALGTWILSAVGLR